MQTATLTGWTQLAPDVRDFEFEVPGVETVAFAPGQFVSFSAEIGGKRITRAYSISSPPDGNRFHICLNRVPEGLFSPLLFSAEPGFRVDMQGPLGTFTLRDPEAESIMVATGTGVAPFRSMISHYLRQGGKAPVTLLFGVRHEENLLYRAGFEEWARLYPNFRFEPTLTRPSDSWTGRAGRVQPHLLELVGDRRDLYIYVCGMKAMVDDVRATMRGLGFDRRRIVVEKYD